MGPGFALFLSFEGITLLRRLGEGWVPLAERPFDPDHLDQALAELRDEALARSSEGTTVAVFLPNEQVRYLSLADPGGGVAERARAVRAAYDGVTPYAVPDLVIDWVPAEGRLKAAAVARETLEEAETFLTACGFVPQVFHAVAAAQDFVGTVHFGAAPGWSGPVPPRPGPFRLLDEAPEAPPAPVEIAAEKPKAAEGLPVTAPVAASVPKKGADPEPVFPEPEPAPKPAPDPVAVPEPAPVVPPPAKPEGEAPPWERDVPPPAAAPASDAQVRFSSIRAARDAPPPPLTAPRLPSGPPRFTPAVPASAAGRPAAATGKAVPVNAPSVAAGSKPVDRPAAPKATVPAPSVAPASQKGATTAPAVAPASKAAAPAPKAPAPKAAPAPAAGTGGKARPAAGPKPAPDRATPTPDKVPAKPAKTPAPDPASAAPARVPPALSMRPTPPAQRRDAPIAARLAAMRREEPDTPAPATPPAALDPEEERRRMTVFGARREETVGGKPRHLGVMLTVVLLVFLAGMAAWASIRFDTGLTQLFAPGPDTVAEPVVAALPEPEPEPEPAQPVAPPDPAEAEQAAPAEVPAPPAPPAIPSTSPEEAAATYAATGVWQRAPDSPLEPPQSTTDDIHWASVDPKVQPFDSVALPDLDATQERDLTLPAVALPPGPGVRFDLDGRGLVRATPEGALSPDGILIYRGQPPQLPPLRSPAATPETPSEAAGDPASEAAALPALRPALRPEDLVALPPEEQAAPDAPPATDASLAALGEIRPALRPLPPPEETAADTAPELPAEDAVADLEAVTPDISASDQAVQRSLAPLLRPRTLEVAPPPQPEPERRVQTASAASVRAAPMPNIPQNTSVAQQATMRGQINLRQLNLIGVYGKPSSRSALIRLPSGRYQKVQVGDQVDGGRVSAIGEDELRYVKGGRNIVLSMPQG